MKGGETMSSMDSSLSRLLLLPEYRKQGYSVEEEGDDILILRCKGKELARFSQKGVTIANIVKIITQEVSQN
jgi:hypothetical protein